MIKLGDVISLDKTIKVDIQDNIEYIIAGVQSYGKGVLNKRKELGINMTMKQYQLIEPNQLMWCKVDTKNGAFGITKSEHKGSLASTNMCLAKIKTDKILPEFLEKLFRIKFFHENITHLSSGTTNRKYLTPNQLCDLIYIPNFTIQEQKDFLQFVNKLESSPIFSHIDYQLTQLENLNQAILQEAVQGKLVPQDTKDEPASELLKRIKAEKAKSGKKEKLLSPIKPEEFPFEIPENWVWCRLGEIAELKSGNQYSYPKSDNGIMYVKVGDMNSEGNEIEIKISSNYFKRDSVKDSDLIPKGSIIFPKRGGAIATNKRRLVKSEPILVDSNTMAVIPYREISIDYFYQWFTTIDLSKLGNDGVIPQVNNKDLNPILFPLPPLSEQKRIVAEIEKQLAKTKQLKEHIIANQQATEQLLKALLHQAFEVKEMEVAKPKGKVIELKPTNVDYYRRTVLAAEIVWQLHKEPTLGHLKLQKLIYLCQKSADMQLPTNFLRQAMGPFDNRLMRSIDKQLNIKKWFEFKQGELLKYKPLEKAGQHHNDFLKYFSAESEGIQFIIDKFRNVLSREIEIWATLYACMDNMLNENVIFSEASLLQRFYEWSEEKKKFSNKEVERVFSRMKDTGIIPKGYNFR